MRFPALLPACALACGSVAALFLSAAPPRPLLVALWIAAGAAYWRRRDALATLLLIAGFAAGGAALARHADLQARSTPLSQLLARQLDAGEHQMFAAVEGVLRADAAQTDSGVTLSVFVDRVTVSHTSYDARAGATISVGGELAGDQFLQWRGGRRVAFPATLRLPTRYLNPGGEDSVRRLAWRGTSAVGAVKSERLVELVAPGTAVSERLAEARARVRSAMASSVGVWSARSAAVATAILIGDRAGLDAGLESRLQKAGTYHVIAISGGNIAIFVALCVAAMRLIAAGPRVSALVAAHVVVAYACLVQGGASVGRATLMAVLYLGVRAFDQSSPPLNVAALAAAASFCAVPLQVVDPGFALTFGATCGILAGMPMLEGILPRNGWRRALAALLAATACAELALMPVGAFVFSRVTLAGLLVNFAAIPAMAIVQVGGMCAAALAWLDAVAASRAAGWVVHAAVEVLVGSAAVVDVAPSLTWRVAPPLVPVMAVYYTALIAAVALRGRPLPVRPALGIVGAVAGWWMLAAPGVRIPWSLDTLRVTFLDVGQGDSALVQFPNGRSLLVDAGGTPAARFDIGARVVSPAVWALGVRRLDYLSVTHGDADHLGGAAAVLEDFGPAEIWEGVPVPPHEPTRALRKAADDAGTMWRTIGTGDRLSIGQVQLHAHHPPTPEWERQRVRNDDSQVIELRYGGVSIVLSGDISREVERAVAGEMQPSPLRVLKVPHHGSATSSSPPFLRMLQPDVAVISAGRGNPFGHPAASVLGRYVREGAAIYRTDRDGAVTLETNGTTLHVRTFSGRRLTLTAFP